MRKGIRDFLDEFNSMPLVLKGIMYLFFGAVAVLALLLLLWIIILAFTTPIVISLIGLFLIGLSIIKLLNHYIKDKQERE